MSEVEKRFEQAMIDIYYKARQECDYAPNRFLQMIYEYGGIAAAKRLLEYDQLHEGLIRLWEYKRLDLSMEALILHSEFQSLFSEKEKQIARERLHELGYQIK